MWGSFRLAPIIIGGYSPCMDYRPTWKASEITSRRLQPKNFHCALHAWISTCLLELSILGTPLLISTECKFSCLSGNIHYYICSCILSPMIDTGIFFHNMCMKNVTRCRGRDDHIKQSSIQTPYISFFMIFIACIIESLPTLCFHNTIDQFGLLIVGLVCSQGLPTRLVFGSFYNINTTWLLLMSTEDMSY